MPIWAWILIVILIVIIIVAIIYFFAFASRPGTLNLIPNTQVVSGSNPVITTFPRPGARITSFGATLADTAIPPGSAVPAGTVVSLYDGPDNTARVLATISTTSPNPVAVSTTTGPGGGPIPAPTSATLSVGIGSGPGTNSDMGTISAIMIGFA